MYVYTLLPTYVYTYTDTHMHTHTQVEIFKRIKSKFFNYNIKSNKILRVICKYLWL